jgi:glycosyltransferase involved in cell wall biosynthesis
MDLLTVIVITHNEELNISDCLDSVKWADEIIVVDSNSSDNTTGLAKQYTTKVFTKEWKGYSEAKNFAIDQATNNWILSLDADERVTPELSKEINLILRNPESEYKAYEVGRRAYFLGKWIRHCGWYPGYVVRLFKRQEGRYNESRVHEKLQVNGNIGRLKNDLIHLTDRNLDHYFSKYNNYTSLAAQDLFENSRSFKITDIVFRPVLTFIKMYFLRFGFLDGIHGFVLSFLSASYVFTKYAKLWERSLMKHRK